MTYQMSIVCLGIVVVVEYLWKHRGVSKFQIISVFRELNMYFELWPDGKIFVWQVHF